jgi:phosphoribosylaminoimidazole (AIR) synthetase
MLYREHLSCVGFQLTTLVVIGTDCIGSYKSNNHTVTATTAPVLFCDYIALQLINQ